MSTRDFIIFILIVVDLLLALWVRRLEKVLNDIEDAMIKSMAMHKIQGEINDRTSKWCKNTDKALDDMLETQEKLVEMGNETYIKYLEVQAQINGIKFEMDQKELVAKYCANDALATEAVLIDEEEES